MRIFQGPLESWLYLNCTFDVPPNSSLIFISIFWPSVVPSWNILKSNSGREFASSWILELKEIAAQFWTNVRM